jgi:hypothetical protein
MLARSIRMLLVGAFLVGPFVGLGVAQAKARPATARASIRKRIHVDACSLLTEPEIEALLRGPIVQKVKDPPKSCDYQIGRQRTTLSISSLPVRSRVDVPKARPGEPERHRLRGLSDLAWWESLSGDTNAKKAFGSVIQLEVFDRNKPAHLRITISSTDEEATTLKAARTLAKLAVGRM